MSTARFTLDGSDALERHLAESCRRAREGVESVVPARALEAIALGGGYGRGEGGVLRTANGDRPYNDLEFYVFARGHPLLNERRYAARLAAVGERLSGDAGVHVEFKVDSLARLRRRPVTMFSYDLVAGHRMIAGGEDCFAGCEHHLEASQIPLHEATRLLFNRCSGLLLVKDLLRRETLTAEDADFIGRNLAKAQLAFGDVVLTVLGFYHWSCVEREARLRKLSVPEDALWLAEAQRCHAAAVEFKLHPRVTTGSREEFEAGLDAMSRLGERIWLWLEGWRLKRRVHSCRAYALGAWPKCPETSRGRNLLLNWRTFGPRAIVSGRLLRYPRERLLNALTLLLWDKDALTEEASRKCLKQNLPAACCEWPELLRAYRKLWPGYG